MIEMSTDNPIWKLVVLKSVVQIKPGLLFMQPMLGLTEHSRNTDSGGKIVQGGQV
jgi:hypothetical protein